MNERRSGDSFTGVISPSRLYPAVDRPEHPHFNWVTGVRTQRGLLWKLIPMHFPARSFFPLLCTFWIAEPLVAQSPFFTDDPAVTERGKWHFEFFNEFDVLQLQYPNIRQ